MCIYCTIFVLIKKHIVLLYLWQTGDPPGSEVCLIFLYSYLCRNHSIFLFGSVMDQLIDGWADGRTSDRKDDHCKKSFIEKHNFSRVRKGQMDRRTNWWRDRRTKDGHRDDGQMDPPTSIGRRISTILWTELSNFKVKDCFKGMQLTTYSSAPSMYRLV